MNLILEFNVVKKSHKKSLTKKQKLHLIVTFSWTLKNNLNFAKVYCGAVTIVKAHYYQSSYSITTGILCTLC